MTRGFTTSDPDCQELAERQVTVDVEVLRAQQASIGMRDDALAELRKELAEAREWAERGWARVQVLEQRLDEMRRVLR